MEFLILMVVLTIGLLTYLFFSMKKKGHFVVRTVLTKKEQEELKKRNLEALKDIHELSKAQEWWKTDSETDWAQRRKERSGPDLDESDGLYYCSFRDYETIHKTISGETPDEAIRKSYKYYLRTMIMSRRVPCTDGIEVTRIVISTE